MSSIKQDLLIIDRQIKIHIALKSVVWTEKSEIYQDEKINRYNVNFKNNKNIHQKEDIKQLLQEYNVIMKEF